LRPDGLLKVIPAKAGIQEVFLLLIEINMNSGYKHSGITISSSNINNEVRIWIPDKRFKEIQKMKITKKKK
jgi:hypothetical protein